MDHIRCFFQVGLNETPLAQIKELRMKKKILAFCLIFTFACELNLGEEGEKKSNGGGCEIRI